MGAPGFRSDVIHQMYHWRIKIAHPIQFQIFIFPVRFDNALSKAFDHGRFHSFPLKLGYHSEQLSQSHIDFPEMTVIHQFQTTPQIHFSI